MSSDLASAPVADVRPPSPRAIPWLDLLLAGIAIAFGAMSLTYPYGHDQGLYGYVAREWMLEGKIPYRDLFDHKPPGIYIIYGFATLLFGTGMWGIRVLDLACVLL